MEKKSTKQKQDGFFMVLREDTNYETRLDEHQDFKRAMEEEGFINVETIPGDGKTTPFKDIWLNVQKTHRIYFVHDRVVDTNYLGVFGEFDIKLIGKLGSWFPSYSEGELLETADLALREDNEKEAATAIFNVAVIYYYYHRAPIMMFERYLNSSNPEIRKGAIRAISFQLWPDCIPMLEKVIQKDPNEEVRVYAQEVLKDIQNLDIQELD
ncbi:MAG: HEAT repeat domain-containing protein [Prochloraceae cyanobacterium]